MRIFSINNTVFNANNSAAVTSEKKSNNKKYLWGATIPAPLLLLDAITDFTSKPKSDTFDKQEFSKTLEELDKELKEKDKKMEEEFNKFMKSLTLPVTDTPISQPINNLKEQADSAGKKIAKDVSESTAKIIKKKPF